MHSPHETTSGTVVQLVAFVQSPHRGITVSPVRKTKWTIVFRGDVCVLRGGQEWTNERSTSATRRPVCFRDRVARIKRSDGRRTATCPASRLTTKDAGAGTQGSLGRRHAWRPLGGVRPTVSERELSRSEDHAHVERADHHLSGVYSLRFIGGHEAGERKALLLRDRGRIVLGQESKIVLHANYRGGRAPHWQPATRAVRHLRRLRVAWPLGTTWRSSGPFALSPPASRAHAAEAPAPPARSPAAARGRHPRASGSFGSSASPRRRRTARRGSPRRRSRR